jgi:hypothetical protein
METGRLRLRGEKEPPAGSQAVNLIFSSNLLRVLRRKNNTSYLCPAAAGQTTLVSTRDFD